MMMILMNGQDKLTSMNHTFTQNFNTSMNQLLSFNIYFLPFTYEPTSWSRKGVLLCKFSKYAIMYIFEIFLLFLSLYSRGHRHWIEKTSSLGIKTWKSCIKCLHTLIIQFDYLSTWISQSTFICTNLFWRADPCL